MQQHDSQHGLKRMFPATSSQTGGIAFTPLLTNLNSLDSEKHPLISRHGWFKYYDLPQVTKMGADKAKKPDQTCLNTHELDCYETCPMYVVIYKPIQQVPWMIVWMLLHFQML
jgi:hypothetical protein